MGLRKFPKKPKLLISPLSLLPNLPNLPKIPKLPNSKLSKTTAIACVFESFPQKKHGPTKRAKK